MPGWRATRCPRSTLRSKSLSSSSGPRSTVPRSPKRWRSSCRSTWTTARRRLSRPIAPYSARPPPPSCSSKTCTGRSRSRWPAACRIPAAAAARRRQPRAKARAGARSWRPHLTPTRPSCCSSTAREPRKCRSSSQCSTVATTRSVATNGPWPAGARRTAGRSSPTIRTCRSTCPQPSIRSTCAPAKKASTRSARA